MRKYHCLFIVLFMLFTANKALPQKPKGLTDLLNANHCKLSFRLNQFDYSFFNRETNHQVLSFSQSSDTLKTTFGGAQWQITSKYTPIENRGSAAEVEVTFKTLCGDAKQANVGVELTFDNWAKENYVLMPASAYNGNRFESRRIRYSPKLLDSRDIGPDKPMIVSDVPRLAIGPGPSVISERSGSMAVPSIGFYSPAQTRSFWLLTTQETRLGDNGIRIEENRDRSRAVISLTAPVVRELYKYYITDNQYPSDDLAPDWKPGDEVTLRFRVYFSEANRIQDLYDSYLPIKNDLMKPAADYQLFSFSSCFDAIEKKFNEQNWVPQHGYYSVGMRENFLQDWQIGWTGGMISTYPLLFGQNTQSVQNVVGNFDWLFPKGLCPAGFFWDSGEKGTQWYGGDIRKPNTKNWHLIRKSGDGLYYVIKQFMLMEKLGLPVKEEWKKGAKTVADAFVTLWNKWGQFGNFVDSQTGDVAVGGSTSGAIVPAAMVLAGKYFGNPEYIKVATASANDYYTKYIAKGITCGGPGDAMQNPDSESSYAMLESFMVLYESTSDKEWLTKAGEMASQFATWVMGYDYRFPENSALGKLGIRTTGTVCANTQNKHAAPGICTHSGVALLRLYRATGNWGYLILLQEIAHSLPQFLSHPARPIEKMKLGWMSERVSTTDWLEGIGELMYGSTWAETSMMLTFIEIPGIYVEPDKGKFMVFDHVTAAITKNTAKFLELSVTNPTKTVARVKMFSETRNEQQHPLPENALLGCKILTLQPGETKSMRFTKE